MVLGLGWTKSLPPSTPYQTAQDSPTAAPGSPLVHIFLPSFSTSGYSKYWNPRPKACDDSILSVPLFCFHPMLSENTDVYPAPLGLFRLTQYPTLPFILQPTAWFRLSFRLPAFPLCIDASSSLPLQFLLDARVVPISWLLS